MVCGCGSRVLEGESAGLFGDFHTINPLNIYWALTLCQFTGLDKAWPWEGTRARKPLSRMSVAVLVADSFIYSLTHSSTISDPHSPFCLPVAQGLA